MDEENSPPLQLRFDINISLQPNQSLKISPDKTDTNNNGAAQYSVVMTSPSTPVRENPAPKPNEVLKTLPKTPPGLENSLKRKSSLSISPKSPKKLKSYVGQNGNQEAPTKKYNEDLTSSPKAAMGSEMSRKRKSFLSTSPKSPKKRRSSLGQTGTQKTPTKKYNEGTKSLPKTPTGLETSQKRKSFPSTTPKSPKKWKSSLGKTATQKTPTKTEELKSLPKTPTALETSQKRKSFPSTSPKSPKKRKFSPGETSAQKTPTSTTSERDIYVTHSSMKHLAEKIVYVRPITRPTSTIGSVLQNYNEEISPRHIPSAKPSPKPGPSKRILSDMMTPDSENYKAPPVKVMLFGHSYIRRINDFMEDCQRHDYRNNKNLGLDPEKFELTAFGVGGSSISEGRKPLRPYMQKVIEADPDIVFLQVGGNDISDYPDLRPRELANNLLKFANDIRSHGVKHVIIGKLFRRSKVNPRVPNYNFKAHQTNKLLYKALKGNMKVSFHRHHGFSIHKGVLCYDGVHLNNHKGMPMFVSSIRVAVEKIFAKLHKHKIL